jgi:hypothetical protein
LIPFRGSLYRRVRKFAARLNEAKPYAEQINPANFLLLAHPDPLDQSGGLPIAPYESNASRWEGLDWIDRSSGKPIRITTEPFDGHERPGVVRVRTYGEVLAGYLTHPEAKSLGPAGQPVGRRTDAPPHRQCRTGWFHRRISFD